MLILIIGLSTILGFLLMLLGPEIGGVIAFGIIAGCLFRGLYLLNDIHKRVWEQDIPLSAEKEGKSVDHT